MRVIFSELEKKAGFSVYFAGKEFAGCYSGTDLNAFFSYLNAVLTPYPSEGLEEVSYPRTDQVAVNQIASWILSGGKPRN